LIQVADAEERTLHYLLNKDTLAKRVGDIHCYHTDILVANLWVNGAEMHMHVQKGYKESNVYQSRGTWCW